MTIHFLSDIMESSGHQALDMQFNKEENAAVGLADRGYFHGMVKR